MNVHNDSIIVSTLNMIKSFYGQFLVHVVSVTKFHTENVCFPFLQNAQIPFVVKIS